MLGSIVPSTILYRRSTQMLQHAKFSLEDESGLIAAYPVKFHKLVTVAPL
jgi:hypothetical protein